MRRLPKISARWLLDSPGHPLPVGYRLKNPDLNPERSPNRSASAAAAP